MQSDNRFFDDVARVTSGAMGALAGVRREIEEMVRQQFHKLLDGMDLVTRDEFDTVREMAANARAENEALEKRIAALEKALAAKPRAPRKAKAASKPDPQPQSEPAPDGTGDGA